MQQEEIKIIQNDNESRELFIHNTTSRKNRCKILCICSLFTIGYAGTLFMAFIAGYEYNKENICNHTGI